MVRGISSDLVGGACIHLYEPRLKFCVENARLREHIDIHYYRHYFADLRYHAESYGLLDSDRSIARTQLMTIDVGNAVANHKLLVQAYSDKMNRPLCNQFSMLQVISSCTDAVADVCAVGSV